MANTRFNYDDARTSKKLDESTGPGRYMLNTPGQGETPHFFNDPYMMIQKWGGNLMTVPHGHPIDIDSDLIGLTKRLGKDCVSHTYQRTAVNAQTQKFPESKAAMTLQSRATHPAWMYLDLEQNHRGPLHLDPLENIFRPFHNNINTRILERDAYDSHL